MRMRLFLGALLTAMTMNAMAATIYDSVEAKPRENTLFGTRHWQAMPDDALAQMTQHPAAQKKWPNMTAKAFYTDRRTRTNLMVWVGKANLPAVPRLDQLSLTEIQQINARIQSEFEQHLQKETARKPTASTKLYYAKAIPLHSNFFCILTERESQADPQAAQYHVAQLICQNQTQMVDFTLQRLTGRVPLLLVNDLQSFAKDYLNRHPNP